MNAFFGHAIPTGGRLSLSNRTFRRSYLTSAAQSRRRRASKAGIGQPRPSQKRSQSSSRLWASWRASSGSLYSVDWTFVPLILESPLRSPVGFSSKWRNPYNAVRCNFGCRVVGYSRLMARMRPARWPRKRHRAQLSTRACQARGAHRQADGRRGDRRVSLGGRCGGMRARRPEITAERGDKTSLRIGVNLGDVIVDGDDIYGEGANVAARSGGAGRARGG